jgi:GMP synthase (glutamine-hydrolysing)
MTVQPADTLLIVDFGSQVTQLIARRIREAGVYCEIAPFNAAEEAFARLNPKGIIFSGGPSSVTWADSPRAPQILFDSGLPLLGICYGQQTLHQQLGGTVVTSDAKEFGRAFIEVVAPSALFDGLWQVGERHQVWMSHGDRVDSLAPDFKVVARSEGAPFAIATNEELKRYSLMFHPEVVHTPDGGKLLANFAKAICGCALARPSRSSPCFASIIISRWCTWMSPNCSLAAWPESPTPKRSASSSARPSSRCSRPRRRRSAAPISSPRARSIRT